MAATICSAIPGSSPHPLLLAWLLGSPSRKDRAAKCKDYPPVPVGLGKQFRISQSLPGPFNWCVGERGGTPAFSRVSCLQLGPWSHQHPVRRQGLGPPCPQRRQSEPRASPSTVNTNPSVEAPKRLHPRKMSAISNVTAPAVTSQTPA